MKSKRPRPTVAARVAALKAAVAGKAPMDLVSSGPSILETATTVLESLVSLDVRVLRLELRLTKAEMERAVLQRKLDQVTVRMHLLQALAGSLMARKRLRKK